MHESVKAYFYDYNAPFEGVVSWLYLDIKGLVTVAVGNLVDPIQYAEGLEFFWPDGRLATPDEFRAAWHRVKSDPNAAKRGHLYAKGLTNIRMSPDGMRALVTQKLEQFAAEIARKILDFDEWPADAQLGMMSLAWACGPAGALRFKFLLQSAAKRDWAAAAMHSQFQGNKDRNAAHKICFRNAAKAGSMGYDPACLFYPRTL
jgi:GH24 family phage-related lysozyme (muramidase)